MVGGSVRLVRSVVAGALVSLSLVGFARDAGAVDRPVRWVRSYELHSPTGPVRPYLVTVDVRTGYAYIDDADELTSTILDLRHGPPRTFAESSSGAVSAYVGVNESNGLAYVPNQITGVIDVFSGTARVETVHLPGASEPTQAVYDPRNHLIYVGNRNANAIYVISGHELVKTILPTGNPNYGGPPPWLGVDTDTGLVYANDPANGSIYVISGHTIRKTVHSAGDLVTVDSRRHLVYLNDPADHHVTIIHGPSLKTFTLHLGQLTPTAIAVNPTTGLLYVTTAQGRLIVADQHRILRSFAIDGLPSSGGVGVDPVNGLIAVPSAHTLLILHGDRVIQRLQVTGDTTDDQAQFDPRTGTLVLTQTMRNRVSILQSPATSRTAA